MRTGTGRGTSFITFNKMIKEGKDSLVNWITETDSNIVAEHILKLNNIDNTSKKINVSREKIKTSIINVLGLVSKGTTGDINYQGLEISIRSASEREYKTRAPGWAFNFIDPNKFDYIIFAGHSEDNKTLYWLLSKKEIIKNATSIKLNQNMNANFSFSLGISSKENTLSCNKYKKYLINKNDLKIILDKKTN
jgi:hypothetical protein